MKGACKKSQFRGIQHPNKGHYISHLFYPDDAIFMSEWDNYYIKNLA